MNNELRLVFWETTRACNLGCPHCRASAMDKRLSDELTLDEAKRIMGEIAQVAKPILVFSGGEPLLRDDIYELSEFATSLGLKAALATNASLVTMGVARKLRKADIKKVAVSVYGENAKAHDSFCALEGAFQKTLDGIENLRKTGIPIQINTTITKKNLNQLEKIAGFALSVGASSYHVFFLVPTGRGKSIEGDKITALEYEEAFNRLYNLQLTLPINIKATCAPHYYRVLRQNGARPGPNLSPKGCLAGQGVCFISYKGEVFGCGYLPIPAGDLRKENFKSIWSNSELFGILRDEEKLLGKCGACEFKKVCSGCRARAYAKTGNYLEEEPECIYEPLTVKS